MFRVIRSLLEDIDSVFDRDPAARNRIEILLLYPHIKALLGYKISHRLYLKKRFFLARFISNIARKSTGIEIHPGATIGKGLFIDHGMGVVIGETAVVGNNVLMYHGSTLGGTGNQKGKRHPTVGDNVIIGASAKILGDIYIASGTRVGANAVVLHDTRPNSTVVGVPAIEIKHGARLISLSDYAI